MTSHLSCLVCDDDESVRIVTEKVFERFTTVHCFVAQNGEQAVEMAKCAKFDFVLMDVIMPGMGGIEAARQIKAIQPKALIFGYTADPDAIRTMDMSIFTASLHKAIRFDEVKNVLHRIEDLINV